VLDENGAGSLLEARAFPMVSQGYQMEQVKRRRRTKSKVRPAPDGPEELLQRIKDLRAKAKHILGKEIEKLEDEAKKKTWIE
jgi:hypothetical protein